MTFAEFVQAATGHALSALSGAELEALEKLYRWGPGPEQAKAYRETHKLESWAATAAHVEGLKS